MINIILHKDFEKQYGKLKPSSKERFKERRNIFIQDPFDPVLNNHSLHGKYVRCRSINITGDIRVVYHVVGENTVQFLTIDTHSNLYK